MKCSNCKSDRIAGVNAKCSDLCYARIGTYEHQGYVPSDMGIGGGDYVEFKWCLDCGRIVGQWPVFPDTDEWEPDDDADDGPDDDEEDDMSAMYDYIQKKRDR